MKQLNKLFPLILTGVFLSIIGWNNFTSPENSSITNFYYYKDSLFYLNLKPDMLFIKLKENISVNEFNNIVGEYGNTAEGYSYEKNGVNQFISLRSPLDNVSLKNAATQLVNNPLVEYASPVFSPDRGKTLIGAENEVIVQFKAGITENEVYSFIGSKGFTVKQVLTLSGGASYVLTVPSNIFSLDAANDIYRSGIVNWSEPNLFFTNLLCYVPNDPFFNMQWSAINSSNNIPGGITGTVDCDMDLDSAWNVTLGIGNCKIAISDTGVDTLHEDLAANMVVGSGFDFYNNDPYAFDDYGHGTCCAGIVAAVGNNSTGISGVAPGCKLIPVKWLSASGNGNYTGAVNATVWSYQKGAWIISNSWGFVGGASSALDQAITDAATFGRSGKGTLFVVAAGNENGAMRYPANTHPRVLVVGGISPCNQRKSPSSCDLEGFWGASYGSNLDIVAPCVKIYATDITGSGGFTGTNYDDQFNGTSSATPNAAGVCGLMLSKDSSMTWDSVRAKIDRSAEKRGAYSYTSVGKYAFLGNIWNNEMGYGLINARLALDLLNPPAANDVSVGPFLSLPAQFVVNSVYSIRAKFTNLGTNNQTNVPTRFTVNGIQVGIGNIANLPSGAVDSAVFPWNPTITGQFTLKIFSALGVDQNRGNDTVTAVVTVVPEGTVITQGAFCRNSLNKAILDNSTVYDTITLNILNSFNVTDANVIIDTVIHTYDADMGFTISHLSLNAVIIDHVGVSGDNFIGTVLNDSAITPIANGTAPFTGSFKPSSALSVFNNNPVNGTWILAINDNGPGDTGTLKAWCLQVTYQTLLGGLQTVEIPNYYSLSQNYPNPFNPVTTIKYGIPKAGNVTLKIYDLLGREVAVLVNETRQPGFYTIDFNATNYASGIYLYKIESGSFSDVKKMMLIK
jgi:subtilisin family serine protease